MGYFNRTKHGGILIGQHKKWGYFNRTTQNRGHTPLSSKGGIQTTDHVLEGQHQGDDVLHHILLHHLRDQRFLGRCYDDIGHLHLVGGILRRLGAAHGAQFDLLRTGTASDMMSLQGQRDAER